LTIIRVAPRYSGKWAVELDVTWLGSRWVLWPPKVSSLTLCGECCQGSDDFISLGSV